MYSRLLVCFLGSQENDLLDTTQNGAMTDTRSMNRLGWDIQVKVSFFFKKRKDETMAGDNDREVQEVDLLLPLAEVPFEFSIREQRLQLFPSLLVDNRVVMV